MTAELDAVAREAKRERGRCRCTHRRRRRFEGYGKESSSAAVEHYRSGVTVQDELRIRTANAQQRATKCALPPCWWEQY